MYVSLGANDSRLTIAGDQARMAPFTHIYFDFFGTLVQYSAGHRGESHEKSHHLLANNGCELSYEDYLVEWESTFERFVQRSTKTLDEFSMDQLCLHFLSTHLQYQADPALVAAFRDCYLEEWSEGVCYIPGLDVLLKNLGSRYPLSVVSNTHHEPLVTGILEGAGILDFFSDVTTSVEHGRRKPCPTIYQRALSATRCAPARGLFVGDSYIHDYEGPRAVGLQALLIDPSGLEDVPDEHRLHSILDLRERIAT